MRRHSVTHTTNAEGPPQASRPSRGGSRSRPGGWPSTGPRPLRAEELGASGAAAPSRSLNAAASARELAINTFFIRDDGRLHEMPESAQPPRLPGQFMQTAGARTTRSSWKQGSRKPYRSLLRASRRQPGPNQRASSAVEVAHGTLQPREVASVRRHTRLLSELLLVTLLRLMQRNELLVVVEGVERAAYSSGHGCFPATNTSPAPEHRAAAISPAGCAPTSPGQDHPVQDLDTWADVDMGLQHVHVKGEDDPLRHL
eukprot:COSAG06_NODE_12111_length_1422_cov_1.881330_2_plen_256_part_01